MKLVMNLSTTAVLLVTTFVLFVSGNPLAAFYSNLGGYPPSHGRGNFGPTAPRCSSASKPCRVKAVLERENVILNEITSQPCSCPDSKSCSGDWRAHRGRVLARELITDGSVKITLMMMFCDPVQPQESCEAGQVAVRLTGMSILPMEVESIDCACSSPRPLVIHQKSVNEFHMNVHSYVCPSDKRRCNTRWRHRDTCLVTDPITHDLDYPCKCPRGYACTSPYDTGRDDYTCARVRRRG